MSESRTRNDEIPGREAREGDLTLGTILCDRYELIDVVGHGGAAIVYRAIDRTLKREVAIKLLDREPGAADEHLLEAHLEIEAHTLAGLDSPHVVPVYDVGCHGQRIFIVMKLYRAPSLEVFLAEHGPLPAARAVHLAAQILDGLAHIHERGLVHRDVKPANILVDGDLAILLDLGIVTARQDRADTAERLVCGTPQYLAPEQALGDGVDLRCDLYSMAITLYELITGRVPFTGTCPLELCRRHVTEKPVPPRRFAEVPAALEAVILRALAKDPDDRYASAAAMKSALIRSTLTAETEKLPQLAPHAESCDAISGRERGRRGDGRVAKVYHPEDELDRAPRRRGARLPMIAVATATSVAAIVALVLAWAPAGPELASAAASVAVPEVERPSSGPPAELSNRVDVTVAPPAATIEDDVDLPSHDDEVARLPTPVAEARPSMATTTTKATAAARRSPPSSRPAIEASAAASREPSPRAAPTPAPVDPTIERLRRAIARTPGQADLYRSAGAAYLRAGNRIAAIAAYRRYLRLAPAASDREAIGRKLDRLGGR